MAAWAPKKRMIRHTGSLNTNKTEVETCTLVGLRQHSGQGDESSGNGLRVSQYQSHRDPHVTGNAMDDFL